MAEIVLGFAASHGPTRNTPPERWSELGEKDQTDARLDLTALHHTPRPGIEQELTLERFRDRYDAVQRGFRALTEVFQEAAPDVVVVFSNPHGGVATDRMQPTFGIHLNDPPPLTESSPGQGRPEVGQSVAPQSTRDGDSVPYPTDGAFALHLMEGLIEEDIDVAANFQSRPGTGLEGSYHLLYQQFDRDASIPHVPVLISRYLPNQATPRRVYEFGQAVRRVIDRWDSNKRVAVMGSGGLSHQIIDEEFDHAVIDALVEGNTTALFSLSRERLNGAPGTPESLNWLACAGAMAPKNMILIGYVPCYRSLAGTGHGNAFGYWR